MFNTRRTRVTALLTEQDAQSLPSGWSPMVVLPSPYGRRRILASSQGSGGAPSTVEFWLEDPHPKVVPVVGLDDEWNLSSGLCAESRPLDHSYVAAEGNRPAAISRRSGMPIGDVLPSGTATAGQVVTLVAPLIELIRELHGAGGVAGAFGLDDLVVDESGRPRLLHLAGTGLSTAGWGERRRPPAGKCWSSISRIVEDALRDEDRRALPRRLRSLLDACAADTQAPDIADALLDALFDWTEPQPLPTGSPLAAVEGSTGGEASSPARNGIGLVDGSREPVRRDGARADMQLRGTHQGSRRLERTRRPLGTNGVWKALHQRVREVTGSVRRPFWVLLAGVVVAGGALVGIQLIGRQEADATAAVDGEHSTATVRNGGVAESAAPSPSPNAAPTRALPATSSPAGVAAPKDRPESVAPTLLARRSKALAARDVRELLAIWMHDAPGLERDLATLTAAPLNGGAPEAPKAPAAQPGQSAPGAQSGQSGAGPQSAPGAQPGPQAGPQPQPQPQSGWAPGSQPGPQAPASHAPETWSLAERRPDGRAVVTSGRGYRVVLAVQGAYWRLHSIDQVPVGAPA